VSRLGTIRLYDTKVLVWEETVEESIRSVYRSVLGRLRFRGFKLARDPNVSHLKSLWPFFHIGQKGPLELTAQTMGRCMEFAFFQSVRRPAKYPNTNGARYDFHEFSLFPRDLRLVCVLEICKLLEKLLEYGYELEPQLTEATPLARAVLNVLERPRSEEAPLADFNRRWQRDRFERGPDGWPTPKEYAHCGYDLDRDQVPIRSGDLCALRVNGRLFNGVAHPQMNSGWSVTCGGTTVHGTSRELFRCERPDLEPRRFFRDATDRLRRELVRELKLKNYARVSQMAAALARLEPPQAVAAE